MSGWRNTAGNSYSYNFVGYMRSRHAVRPHPGMQKPAAGFLTILNPRVKPDEPGQDKSADPNQKHSVKPGQVQSKPMSADMAEDLAQQILRPVKLLEGPLDPRATGRCNRFLRGLQKAVGIVTGLGRGTDPYVPTQYQQFAVPEQRSAQPVKKTRLRTTPQAKTTTNATDTINCKDDRVQLRAAKEKQFFLRKKMEQCVAAIEEIKIKLDEHRSKEIPVNEKGGQELEAPKSLADLIARAELKEIAHRNAQSELSALEYAYSLDKSQSGEYKDYVWSDFKPNIENLEITNEQDGSKGICQVKLSSIIDEASIISDDIKVLLRERKDKKSISCGDDLHLHKTQITEKILQEQRLLCAVAAVDEGQLLELLLEAATLKNPQLNTTEFEDFDSIQLEDSWYRNTALKLRKQAIFESVDPDQIMAAKTLVTLYEELTFTGAESGAPNSENVDIYRNLRQFCEDLLENFGESCKQIRYSAISANKIAVAKLKNEYIKAEHDVAVLSGRGSGLDKALDAPSAHFSGRWIEAKIKKQALRKHLDDGEINRLNKSLLTLERELGELRFDFKAADTVYKELIGKYNEHDTSAVERALRNNPVDSIANKKYSYFGVEGSRKLADQFKVLVNQLNEIEGKKVKKANNDDSLAIPIAHYIEMYSSCIEAAVKGIESDLKKLQINNPINGKVPEGTFTHLDAVQRLQNNEFEAVDIHKIKFTNSDVAEALKSLMSKSFHELVPKTGKQYSDAEFISGNVNFMYRLDDIINIEKRIVGLLIDKPHGLDFLKRLTKQEPEKVEPAKTAEQSEAVETPTVVAPVEEAGGLLLKQGGLKAGEPPHLRDQENAVLVYHRASRAQEEILVSYVPNLSENASKWEKQLAKRHQLLSENVESLEHAEEAAKLLMHGVAVAKPSDPVDKPALEDKKLPLSYVFRRNFDERAHVIGQRLESKEQKIYFNAVRNGFLSFGAGSDYLAANDALTTFSKDYMPTSETDEGTNDASPAATPEPEKAPSRLAKFRKRVANNPLSGSLRNELSKVTEDVHFATPESNLNNKVKSLVSDLKRLTKVQLDDYVKRIHSGGQVGASSKVYNNLFDFQQPALVGNKNTATLNDTTPPVNNDLKSLALASSLFSHISEMGHRKERIRLHKVSDNEKLKIQKDADALYDKITSLSARNGVSRASIANHGMGELYSEKFLQELMNLPVIEWSRKLGNIVGKREFGNTQTLNPITKRIKTHIVDAEKLQVEVDQFKKGGNDLPTAVGSISAQPFMSAAKFPIWGSFAVSQGRQVGAGLSGLLGLFTQVASFFGMVVRPVADITSGPRAMLRMSYDRNGSQLAVYKNITDRSATIGATALLGVSVAEDNSGTDAGTSAFDSQISLRATVGPTAGLAFNTKRSIADQVLILRTPKNERDINVTSVIEDMDHLHDMHEKLVTDAANSTNLLQVGPDKYDLPIERILATHPFASVSTMASEITQRNSTRLHLGAYLGGTTIGDEGHGGYIALGFGASSTRSNGSRVSAGAQGSQAVSAMNKDSRILTGIEGGIYGGYSNVNPAIGQRSNLASANANRNMRLSQALSGCTLFKHPDNSLQAERFVEYTNYKDFEKAVHLHWDKWVEWGVRWIEGQKAEHSFPKYMDGQDGIAEKDKKPYPLHRKMLHVEEALKDLMASAKENLEAGNVALEETMDLKPYVAEQLSVLITQQTFALEKNDTKRADELQAQIVAILSDDSSYTPFFLKVTSRSMISTSEGLNLGAIAVKNETANAQRLMDFFPRKFVPDEDMYGERTGAVVVAPPPLPPAPGLPQEHEVFV